MVAIYSTFLQRAYDQLIHDVAIQNLPVVFAIDRGGLVGADGPTHHGAFDLSYLRCIPNLVVMTPSDENECRQMLYTAFQLDQPAAVRYPRGSGPGVPGPGTHAGVCRSGEGSCAGEAAGWRSWPSAACSSPAWRPRRHLDATVANMRFVKPLDEASGSANWPTVHDLLVTVEENVVLGGAGSAVLEYLAAQGKADAGAAAWACRIASSSMAIRRCCSRSAVWTRAGILACGPAPVYPS